MKSQSPSALRAAVKTPTTQTVVSKVQSITAKKNQGQQARWVANLQRTVDTTSRFAALAATSQNAVVSRPGQAKTQGAALSNGHQHGDQKGSPPRPQPTNSTTHSKKNPADDNRSNQLNTNHEQYYKSRGLAGRPTDRTGLTETVRGKQKQSPKHSK